MAEETKAPKKYVTLWTKKGGSTAAAKARQKHYRSTGSSDYSQLDIGFTSSGEKIADDPKTIAVRGETESGNVVVVTKSGQITERTQAGDLIRRYQTDPIEASKITSKYGGISNYQVMQYQKAKMQEQQRESMLSSIYPKTEEKVTIPKSGGGYSTYYSSGLVETQLPGQEKQEAYISKGIANQFITDIGAARTEATTGLREQAEYVDWKFKPFGEKLKTITYGKTEKLIADYTTKRILPYFPFEEKAKDWFGQRLPSITVEQQEKLYALAKENKMPLLASAPIFREIARTSQTMGTGSMGIMSGMYNYVREKPLTTSLLFGAGYAIPRVIAATEYALTGTKVGEILSAAWKLKSVKALGFTAKWALPAAYIGLKGYDVYKAPTLFKKGEVFGGAITEVTAVFAGADLGTMAARPTQLKTALKRGRIFSEKWSAKGTEPYTQPGKTFFKEELGYTRQEIQSQLIKKKLIIEGATRQQPLKVEYYKDYWSTEKRGIRSYLGRWAEISRPSSKVQLEFITRPTTQTSILKYLDQYPISVFAPRGSVIPPGKTTWSSKVLYKLFSKKYPIFNLRTEQVLEPSKIYTKFSPLIDVGKQKDTIFEVISGGRSLYSSFGLKPITGHYEALGLLLGTRQQPKTIQVPQLSYFQKQIYDFQFKQLQIQMPDLYIPPTTVTKQVTDGDGWIVPFVPPPPGPRPPPTPPPVPPPIPIFKFKWPEGGGMNFFLRPRRKLKRPTKYQPSLFTRRGKMPKLLTGWEVRPIISF